MKKFPKDTSRIEFRELTMEDMASVHAYATDEEVIKYVDFGPNTEEVTREFLELCISYQSEENRRDYEIAVIEKATGNFMGVCGTHIVSEESRQAWIGYVLNKAYWNKGYGREMAAALLDFGIDQLKLHRIYATCEPDNIGSKRVLEKIGMTKEGHLRENIYHRNKWRDSLLFSILEDEYRTIYVGDLND